MRWYAFVYFRGIISFKLGTGTLKEDDERASHCATLPPPSGSA